MSTNAFSKMAEYFNSLVQEITSEARQAGMLQNPTAVGTGREEIFRRLLERHLPDTCEVFREAMSSIFKAKRRNRLTL